MVHSGKLQHKYPGRFLPSRVWKGGPQMVRKNQIKNGRTRKEWGKIRNVERRGSYQRVAAPVVSSLRPASCSSGGFVPARCSPVPVQLPSPSELLQQPAPPLPCSPSPVPVRQPLRASTCSGHLLPWFKHIHRRSVGPPAPWWLPGDCALTAGTAALLCLAAAALPVRQPLRASTAALPGRRRHPARPPAAAMPGSRG